MTYGGSTSLFGGDMSFNRVQVMKAELMSKITRLGDTLPMNTLDTLIDQLGGPDCVAEVSVHYCATIILITNIDDWTKGSYCCT
jgi:hypothetical protein